VNQIAPGRAAVLTPTRPYHQVMEGNTPPDRVPHATHQPAPAPYNGAPPPPWPPQAHPYPMAPAAKSGRSLWIIFAGIVIAGALIAGAAFLALSGKDTPAPTASPTTPPASSSQPAASDVDNSTCKAWRTTKQTLLAIPLLPAGWDWNTPNIDTYIQNRTTAIDRALELFEPKITPDPADAAEAARTYIATRRSEAQKLRDHTFSSQDVVDSNAASAELDQVCGVAG
jgi:hypothetical protein